MSILRHQAARLYLHPLLLLRVCLGSPFRAGCTSGSGERLSTRQMTGENTTYTPKTRSWRGSALCIPFGAPLWEAKQLHSDRMLLYTYRPNFHEIQPHWPSGAYNMMVEYRCNLCTLSGLGLPGPWRHEDNGHFLARCGGNGTVIHLCCGGPKTWTKSRRR